MRRTGFRVRSTGVPGSTAAAGRAPPTPACRSPGAKLEERAVKNRLTSAAPARPADLARQGLPRRLAAAARKPRTRLPPLARKLQPGGRQARAGTRMESTAYIALSRQMVLDRQMDVIAHNIANATTSGLQGRGAAARAGAGRRRRAASGWRSSRTSAWSATSPGPDHRHRQSARPGDRGARLFRDRDGRGGPLRPQRPVPPQRARRARDRGGRPGARRRRRAARAAARRRPDHDRRRRHGVERRGRRPAGIERRDLRRRAAPEQGRRRPLSDRSGAAAGGRGAPGAGRARGLERASRSSR